MAKVYRVLEPRLFGSLMKIFQQQFKHTDVEKALEAETADVSNTQGTSHIKNNPSHVANESSTTQLSDVENKVEVANVDEGSESVENKKRKIIRVCCCQLPQIGACYDIDDQGNVIPIEESDSEEEEEEQAPSSLASAETDFGPRAKKAKVTNDSSTLQKRVVKVHNHNHDTGLYESSLCQGCNLRIRYKYELPCISHNSSKYDHHLLLKYMNTSLFDFEDIMEV
ncbi:unnamed protein product [Allacma fusca]|uniref:Uncharacterized protein n=1 Tax=Allacma fusca TaxID=39272 RepID=A0A8J2KWJ9_9HEXA|nr:unnamed protein product [Allacma fusca]